MQEDRMAHTMLGINSDKPGGGRPEVLLAVRDLASKNKNVRGSLRPPHESEETPVERHPKAASGL